MLKVLIISFLWYNCIYNKIIDHGWFSELQAYLLCDLHMTKWVSNYRYPV